MAKAKEIEGLDCGEGASRGMRLVLLARLGEVCGQREAVLGAESVDGVHDMRVASRRLRSALRDFRPHLAEGGRLKEARRELKRLADALGAVRDEDVAAAALEKLKGEAPEEAREGLGLLADGRRERRALKFAALARELDAESFDETRRRVEQVFTEASEHPKDDEGEESFRELGRRVVRRSWKELASRGAEIYRPLKSRRLHKLRIAAKRLRYSLELFAACYGDEAKVLARELAALQKALGNLHDCDEWIEECGRLLSSLDALASDESRAGESGRAFNEASVESADGESARRAAALWLIGHFLEKRGRHYAEALAVWRGFEEKSFDSRLADVFKDV